MSEVIRRTVMEDRLIPFPWEGGQPPPQKCPECQITMAGSSIQNNFGYVSHGFRCEKCKTSVYVYGVKPHYWT